jgi:hypothetical protein
VLFEKRLRVENYQSLLRFLSYKIVHYLWEMQQCRMTEGTFEWQGNEEVDPVFVNASRVRTIISWDESVDQVSAVR